MFRRKKSFNILHCLACTIKILFDVKQLKFRSFEIGTGSHLTVMCTLYESNKN